MSNCYIRLELDNAAFDDTCGREIARILRKLACRVEDLDREELDGFDFTPIDINGNCVGTVDFEIDEPVDEEEL
jgi:hypothetical protein